MVTTFLNTCKLPDYERVRNKLRTLGCVVLSLSLCSCATLVDFSSWHVGYNNSVERARNQLMLLNIVRASENMPLLFTGVQVVRGNGQNTVGGGVGGTWSATDAGAIGGTSVTNALAPSVNFAVTSGFNFDVVVLDSAEFLQGLLTPISVLTFDHYARMGIPEELLVHLLVQNITFTADGQPTVTYHNEPLSRDYKLFRGIVASLIDQGITTEVGSSASESIGPLLTDADLKAGGATEFAKTLPGLFLAKVPGGYRFFRPGGSIANFCFMGPENGQTAVPQESLCAQSPVRKTGRTKAGTESIDKSVLRTANAAMSVQMRTTSGVFNYLGNLARHQAEYGADILTLSSPEAMAYQSQSLGRSMFHVLKNQPGQYDIASVEYRGTVYSLPLKGEGYSATVLLVLTQLFSLSKSVNSIPSTGTVIVR